MNLQRPDPATLLDVFESSFTVRKGDRVKVCTRHGSTGTGKVVGIRDNHGHCPDTIVVEMDADTIWRTKGLRAPWPSDELRSNTFGLFGGEIDSVLPNTVH